MTTEQTTEHQSRTAALRAEFNREWAQRTDLDAYTPGQQHRLMVDAWREKLSQSNNEK